MNYYQYMKMRKRKISKCQRITQYNGSRERFYKLDKRQNKKYDFVQDEDYILTLAKIGERKNVVKHEYFLTINMAKEIAMVENNEMGRK